MVNRKETRRKRSQLLKPTTNRLGIVILTGRNGKGGHDKFVPPPNLIMKAGVNGEQEGNKEQKITNY